MENTEQNGHNNPKLDRLEKLRDLLITDHSAFSDEHKRLRTAQVVLTENVRELREAQRVTDEQMKRTDERLNALISVVDQLVRNRPSL